MSILNKQEYMEIIFIPYTIKNMQNLTWHAILTLKSVTVPLGFHKNSTMPYAKKAFKEHSFKQKAKGW